MVSLTTICQISPLCHLLLHYSWDCLTAKQHKKMLEQTENVAYNTNISLTFGNKTPVKTKNFTVTKLMLAASHCALAIMLSITTKATRDHLWFELHLESTVSHNSCSDILAL